MWALGVVCYVLVTGKVPFYGQTQSAVMSAIAGGTLKWPQSVRLSASCKHFVGGLLCRNVSARMSCAEALEHEWIAEEGKASNADFGASYLSEITLFSTANKLQKVLIEAVFVGMELSERRWLLSTLQSVRGQIDGNDAIDYILTFGAKDSHSALTVPSSGDTVPSVDIDHLMDELDAVNAFNVGDDEMDSVHCCNDDDDGARSLRLSTEHVLCSSEHVQSPLSAQSPSKISIAHFAAIMESAEKQYDVDSLVHRLGPTPSGKIPLQRIHEFDGMLCSKESDRRIIDDLMSSGIEAHCRCADDKDTQMAIAKMQQNEFVIIEDHEDQWDEHPDDGSSQRESMEFIE